MEQQMNEFRNINDEINETTNEMDREFETDETPVKRTRKKPELFVPTFMSQYAKQTKTAKKRTNKHKQNGFTNNTINNNMKHC